MHVVDTAVATFFKVTFAHSKYHLTENLVDLDCQFVELPSSKHKHVFPPHSNKHALVRECRVHKNGPVCTSVSVLPSFRVFFFFFLSDRLLLEAVTLTFTSKVLKLNKNGNKAQLRECKTSFLVVFLFA